VVVGDLGADVVRNVGLAEAVNHPGADGSEEGAVNGAESATGEGPEAVRVVGKGRVGVPVVVSYRSLFRYSDTDCKYVIMTKCELTRR
jgi:hypothetical protein